MATYAMSDIHGEWNILKTILKFLKKDDKLIFLGDANDRGPAPVTCMRALLEDSRVTYLRGNHEEFFSRFLTIYGTEEESQWMSGWVQNGGRATLKELREYSNDEIADMIEKVSQLPIFAEYTNAKGEKFILCHAGYTPEYTEELEPTWDREHFEDKWVDNEYDYLVHGHTPIPYICDVIDGWEAIQYCNGHKIDIDLATYYTKKVALLNLDDLSVTYFEEDYDTITLDTPCKDVSWYTMSSCYKTEKIHVPRKGK